MQLYFPAKVMHLFDFQAVFKDYLAISFGNLAQFYLAIWRGFVWQFGAISFGNLAQIRPPLF